MNELLSWESLGTLVGATAAVLLITQYVKPWLKNVDPRAIALVLAVLIMEAVTIVTGAKEWSAYVLSALNAVVVAAAAMGSYEVTYKPVDDARKTEEGGAESGGDG